MTLICISKLTIIGPDNGLLSSWRQVIWTNAGILLIWTLGTHFSAVKFRHFHSFENVVCEMAQKFCLGLNVLTTSIMFGVGKWMVGQGSTFSFVWQSGTGENEKKKFGQVTLLSELSDGTDKNFIFTCIICDLTKNNQINSLCFECYFNIVVQQISASTEVIFVCNQYHAKKKKKKSCRNSYNN